MGHARNSTRDTYIQDFPAQRLVNVVNHVRNWLYGEATEEEKAATIPFAG